ncbi:hypothetical protein [Spongiactinospora sp. 9N601]|uniref:hypothetical protein n=1 Tax=Spongiactinospora sp. 9N601 TaxID=3375149 RepID=UPI0037B7587A
MPFRIPSVAALLAVLLLAFAAPAAAHPFGPPSTASLRADGPRVELAWRSAEDDWVALGQSLGAFEDPGSGPVSTALTGEQKLGRSAAVRTYLLARVRVAQRGRACPGRLAELRDLLAEGARFTFECPGPVSEVELTMTPLTDLNPAYRTVVSAASGKVMFTSSAGTQRVPVAGTAGGPPAAVWALGAGTLAVVLAAAGVLVWRRARRGRVAA